MDTCVILVSDKIREFEDHNPHFSRIKQQNTKLECDYPCIKNQYLAQYITKSIWRDNKYELSAMQEKIKHSLRKEMILWSP